MGLRTGVLSGILVIVMTSGARAVPSVPTQHNDNARTGVYHDPILNTTNVQFGANQDGSRFRRLHTYPVCGDIYAQPLYMPHVNLTPDSQAPTYKDLVFIATSSNYLYAFDAGSNSPNPVWVQGPDDLSRPAGHHPDDDSCGALQDNAHWFTYHKFGSPIPARDTLKSWLWSFASTIGIISTPVVDESAGIIYALAKEYDRSTEALMHNRHVLHAFRISDGVEVGSLKLSDQMMPGGQAFNLSPNFYRCEGRQRPNDPPGQGVCGMLAQDQPGRQVNRAALLLYRPVRSSTISNGPIPPVIVVAFGSPGDSQPYSGLALFIDAADPANLAYLDRYDASPFIGKGGIWQSGQGPASDGENVFLQTGDASSFFYKCTAPNGDPLARPDLRDTDGCYQLTDPNPRPSGGNPALPYEPTQADATSFVKINWNDSALLPITKIAWHPSNWLYLAGNDLDLGSSGPLLLPFLESQAMSLPAHHPMTGGGKDGRLFLMDRDSVVPLQWGQATFMMNPPMPLKTCGGSANLSKHIHGSPVFWNRQGSAPRVFLWGENDHLRAFELCDVGGHWRYCDNQPSGLRPAALSAMTVPAGMPGGVLSLSVNPSVDEDKSGILWVNHPCFWNPAANDGNGECEICPDAVGCFPENGAYYCGTDAEVYVSPGILRAFNAYSGSHFPNPEVPMTEIWNSGRESTDAYDADGMGGRGWTANVLGAYPPAPPSLSYAKFTAPTVANGRVYVPTFANSTGHAAVIVYGLGYNPPPN